MVVCICMFWDREGLGLLLRFVSGDSVLVFLYGGVTSIFVSSEVCKKDKVQVRTCGEDEQQGGCGVWPERGQFSDLLPIACKVPDPC